MRNILVFGYGYVGKFLSKRLAKNGWKVYSTSRNINISQPEKLKNITIYNFEDPMILEIIKKVDYILNTIPPYNNTDPVLSYYHKELLKKSFKWVGYLSSTGVYGNYNGEWVNEETICIPTNDTSKQRLIVEGLWMVFFKGISNPVNIFRLSGIYGPSRNIFEQIKKGKIHTTYKPGHYFSRIHVEDICQILIHSMNNITHGQIYNISDDKPEQLHVLHDYATTKMNVKPLIKVPIDDASLPKRAKEFFSDNKKVSNEKIKSILMIKLLYPNYKLGLDHLYSYLK